MYGGSIADPHEFPWIVQILKRETQEESQEYKLMNWCGGSIIGRQWILTGHCIKFWGRLRLAVNF